MRLAYLGLAVVLSSACLNPGSGRGELEDDGGIDGIDSDQDRCSADVQEPNDGPAAMTRLSWDSLSTLDDDGQDQAALVLDATVCSADHDWYLLPIGELDFDFHVVRIDGLVHGASWCGQFDGCDGEVLPDAPENTLAVEVYDAASKVLLAADVATNGRVDVDGWGANFSKDLLIHVYGPSNAASYGYELHVDVRNYDAEDDCEC